MSLTGFEQIQSWSAGTTVACRHDYERSSSASGGGVGVARENTDNDIFFFNPDVSIAEGNRIVHDGKNYDVIKISKMYDSGTLHHLEVTGRVTTHD